MKTKQQALLEFCATREFISKSDIIGWGLDNFYIRSERQVRKFCQDGLMRKVSPEGCLVNGLKGKQTWYQVCEVK
jgi:hypothetical protein